jgi:threonylcarbamoyladenosine tRNA methylthiotransferase CDKAL1
MARIYLETYGCTLNQADSDIIRALLCGEHTFQDKEEGSDVVILNTCTVKGATENRIMLRIRRLREKGVKVVVVGCMIANEKKIRKLAPEAPIVAPSSLRHISDAVRAVLSGSKEGMVYKTPESKDGLPKLLTAPIARIPINEGCTSACAFCQTKLARPFLRSYSPKSIVKWINEAVAGGAKEIQLTSMDSGAYGLDIKTDLVSLMELIANDDSSSASAAEGGREYKIRLGMINPNHAKRILPGLIKALKRPKFYKFLHIPVQTGSERICRAMNRDHTVKDFVEIVGSVRKEIPEVSIATDIIAGYPGETEEDHQDTLRMLKKTMPDVMNVSKFSPRAGTKAMELKALPDKLVKSRSAEASALGLWINAKTRKPFIGRALEVLMTEKTRDFKGRDINYRQVIVKRFKGSIGDTIIALVKDANHGSFFGEQIGKKDGENR